ncbi:Membrane attack complex component/perforin (MACPF) domain [Dillenia turbinata]|uniref:Membrane attack complex component/perforin (MACPF) domain n=1 Tax=Dillenia turbinata TaxID=194707 RepID=A0AAN8UTM3_9MAGN
MSEGIVERAFKSLGKGFDLTHDFRLNYCKGKERLVKLNDSEKQELNIPGFGTFKHISVDIKCDKGDQTRYQSDILEFNQMSELFNQRSSVPGKIPSGLFNAVYGFESGSWAMDASNMKSLGLVGYFFILFNVHIARYPLILSDEVRNAVPSIWDPCALARFIETYGTHIIVGLNIGGQDVVPQAFNVFDPLPISYNGITSVTAKDGVTVICSKRGGDTSVRSHCEWLLTVPSMPDAINFNFIPITSLLKGVPGKGFLSHAINLYLRYKPPMAELPYFLDFQAHKIWAPIYSDLPLGPPASKAVVTPTLQFSMMGSKLYVNTTKVVVGKRPVTGMRLYLEGMKSNRLAIHLQHLASTPLMLQNNLDETYIWHGTEEIAHQRYFEPIKGKKFSHVCTSRVKFEPSWTTNNNVAFIVTGAQLHVKTHDSKSVLHLRLLYSKLHDFCVAKSTWTQPSSLPSSSTSSEFSQRSGLFSAISASLAGNSGKGEGIIVVDSAVFPGGPPAPVAAPKQLKFVDRTHLCMGPQDSPGHWLVTGAQLNLEKGKICLHVKFSLLNKCS